MPLATRIIFTHGAIVGHVRDVRIHPYGDLIRLSYVDLGDDEVVQIVFGGHYQVEPNDLVPVAPPGSRVIIEHIPTGASSRKKMRSRRYRGVRSHGMLCSLNELGWAFDAPDEVATLCNVKAGEKLDGLSFHERVDRVDRHLRHVVPLGITAGP